MPASILAEIAERRRAAIRERKRVLGTELPPRPAAFGPARVGAFRRALARPDARTPVRLLCELKKASPSKGLLRADFDIEALARGDRDGGAAALSVLTEPEYFQGDATYLTRARAASRLPCLLKDFVIDAWQLDEALSLGADGVLLIVALLPLERLESLVRQAHARGLDALVEIHTEAELDLALEAGADLVGINNRDLGTFQVDPGITLALRPRVPAGVTVVSESGIATAEDIARLSRAGVDAALIGEAFMREPDVAAAVRALVDAASAAAAG
ncbi:MAG: indole-3-glycerol phosphate synthase TrpC [Candidatus Eisenbacteria bacterium]